MGVVFAFCQAIVWASTNIILRPLADRIHPLVLNGVRCLFGLAVILLVIIPTGRLSGYAALTPRILALIWGAALIGGVLADGAYVTALKHLGVGRAFPIANAYPVATMAASAIILGQAPTPRMLAGTALVLGGIYLVARPPHQGNSLPKVDRRKLWFGVSLALLANLGWGIQGPIYALGLRAVDPLVANTLRIPAVALVSLGLAGATRNLGGLKKMDRRTWALLALTGILGWGVAASFESAAIQMAGPSKTAIIAATAPIFALPMSVIFLQERLSASILLGTTLTIAGLVLVVWTG